MKATKVTIVHPPEMTNLVTARLQELAADLRSRGIEVAIAAAPTAGAPYSLGPK